MTGMTAKEKIIASITDEAKKQAEEIISSALKNAEKEKKEALQKAEENYKRTISEAEIKAETIRQAGESSAALLKRDRILARKQELIEQVLEEVKNTVNAMNDEDYFNFLYELVEINSEENSGELMLSATDYARNTQNFEKKIAAKGLKLSNEKAQISGGFILKYGDIEINCDIDALIDGKREKIIDIANKILF